MGNDRTATAAEGAVTAPSLDVPHGFLTRLGGVSNGLYRSLNCGRGSGDDPGAVERNRAIAAGVLGAGPDALVTAHQVHSARVVRVEEPGAQGEADGLVTDRPGVVLGVLTADCAPVLLSDAEARVVGAAHAGWRGAWEGIVEATVEAMVGLGARPDRIRAAVGPCIGPRSYEVGPEFEARLLDRDPGDARFFAQGGERARFDLPGYVLHRLRGAGLGSAEWTGQCTFAEPKRFFSYRRSVHRGEADYGRMIALVRLPPA